MSKTSTAAISRPATEGGGESLPAVARAAILEALSGKPAKKNAPPPPAPGGYLAQKRAIFITLFDKNGELRGCAGSVEPKGANLLEEARLSGHLAARGGPVHPPVKDARELKQLTIEVSVLSPPERVESIIDLDPEIYGVILTAAKTGNRGVMLPHMPGLNTVDKQLAAIRRAAGLKPDERLRIERFRVERFAE